MRQNYVIVRQRSGGAGFLEYLARERVFSRCVLLAHLSRLSEDDLFKHVREQRPDNYLKAIPPPRLFTTGFLTAPDVTIFFFVALVLSLVLT